MLRAAKEVCINKRSCRGVATNYDIKPTTLRRYCMMNQAKLDGEEEINIICLQDGLKLVGQGNIGLDLFITSF